MSDRTACAQLLCINTINLSVAGEGEMEGWREVREGEREGINCQRE